MPKDKKSTKPNFLSRLHGIHKLLISLTVAVIVYCLISSRSIGILPRIFIGWDVFSAVLLCMTWIVFFTVGSQHIREESKIQDESRTVIFFIVVIAALAGLLGVLQLVLTKNQTDHEKAIVLPIAILGLLFSWLLVHSIFTVRYAHLYYGNDPDQPETHVGGLKFPSEDRPDFLDFAYFSFVLGMTFQVSDVEVSSKKMRRIALFHGLLSFGYNTVIVALTINIIGNLK